MVQHVPGCWSRPDAWAGLSDPKHSSPVKYAAISENTVVNSPCPIDPASTRMSTSTGAYPLFALLVLQSAVARRVDTGFLAFITRARLPYGYGYPRGYAIDHEYWYES
eukprot:scaffold156630_cov22-Prasinocladus_malaysianus.AAC.1